MHIECLRKGERNSFGAARSRGRLRLLLWRIVRIGNPERLAKQAVVKLARLGIVERRVEEGVDLGFLFDIRSSSATRALVRDARQRGSEKVLSTHLVFTQSLPPTRQRLLEIFDADKAALVFVETRKRGQQLGFWIEWREMRSEEGDKGGEIQGGRGWCREEGGELVRVDGLACALARNVTRRKRSSAE